MKKILGLLVVIAASFTLLSWSGETVAATAEKFLNALYHLDMAMAKSVATAETQKQLEGYEQMMSFVQGSAREEAKKTKVSIINSLVSGDHATVDYKITYPEDNSTKTVKLVRVGADWKVEWTKTDGINMDPTLSPAVDTTSATAVEEPENVQPAKAAPVKKPVHKKR